MQGGWVSAGTKGGSLDAPLDVPSAMRARRATKQFSSRPLPEGALDRLIELTTLAPSGFNVQDWKIVVVQSPEQRQALSAAAYNQPQILSAPVTFVFAADVTAASRLDHLKPIADQARELKAWPDAYVDRFADIVVPGHAALGSKAREYAVKNAMLAAAHLLIGAASLGLDTSPMNGWVEDEVKKVIGAPDDPDLAIAVLVSVGYGEGGLGNPGRLPRNANVFLDSLRTPFE